MKRPDGHCSALSRATASSARTPARSGEVQPADVLVAGAAERAAVGVRVAPPLVLVALDRVGLDPRAGLGHRLLGPAAVGRGERLRLAEGVVAGLRERDAGDAASRLVRGEQVADLLLERDAERVLLDGRLEGAVGGRPVVEPDPVAEGGGGGLRDPDRLGGDAVGLGGGQDARAGEAPAPVDEDANPEALALAGGNALDPAALDGDRLVAPVDDPDVGVGGTLLDGGVEGTVAQVTHRGRRVSNVPAPVGGALSLFRTAGAPHGARAGQRTGRPATADQVRTTPRPSTATEARSGAAVASRPSVERLGIRSSRLRATTITSPTPVITAAIPSPNATTRTNPNAGRPVAIEPSRMSSAEVEGIRPPARPRTNRPRHDSVRSAGGRWLWARPPWLWTPASSAA